MKLKHAFTMLGLFAIAFSHAQNIGINSTNTAPFEGAILDVQSTTKGMLMPRMTTVQRQAMTSLTPGLIVYDTDLDQFFYYTNAWQAIGSGTGWALGGNAGIVPGQFLGTTDAVALRFRTNNTERLSIDVNGNILVPTDQQTLRFSATTNTSNRPMIQMFTSGTQNSDRMVLSHSPSFPTWGIEYKDTTDVMFLRDGSVRRFAFELASGHMGIGLENPEYSIDAVGRLRLRSDGNFNNSPGIWFSNNTNTFDRAFLGMSKPDSGFGIFSQHLGNWAIEFELMREPRIGINTKGLTGTAAGVVRAELHIGHTNFGGSNDGVRIQNEGPNEHYWNLYTSNTTGDFEFFKQGIKRATINQTSGAYTAVSDEKLKRNVRPMAANTLSKVMMLRPTSYQFIGLPNDEGGTYKPDGRFYNGFIAQEVESVFPELVFKGSDNPAQDFYTMDYAGFGVVAIKAIQEQQVQITSQRNQIARQQQELDGLKLQLEQLMLKVEQLTKAAPGKM